MAADWIASRARQLKRATTSWLGGWGGTEQKGQGKNSSPEADRLRAALRSARADASSAKRDLDDALALLQTDFGPSSRYFPLRGRCFSYAPGGEFSYELCPFDKATQSGGTTLGKWKGWGDGYSVFEFDQGAHCWATGKGRTATAKLECAEENVVLNVDEPEVCSYAFVFGTPSACTTAHVDEARREAGMPPLAQTPAGAEEEEHDEL